jgi:hypothetical protein
VYFSGFAAEIHTNPLVFKMTSRKFAPGGMPEARGIPRTTYLAKAADRSLRPRTSSH